jgi:hypothetical protein
MFETITANIDVISLVTLLVDIALTRCPKFRYRGLVLRAISILGKAAQAQVDKGNK